MCIGGLLTHCEHVIFLELVTMSWELVTMSCESPTLYIAPLGMTR
jgi:hypothetical protein